MSLPNRERARLAVRRHFVAGLNTAEIGRKMKRPEHEVDRLLHAPPPSNFDSWGRDKRLGRVK